MKNHLLGMILLSAIALFACTEKVDELSPTLKSPVDKVVADETATEGIIESIDYEANLYANGAALLSSYNTTLKSEEVGKFNNFFKNYTNFLLRYKNGVVPNISFVSTAGKYPLSLIIDYGTGLELENGRILSGKITVKVTQPIVEKSSEQIVTYTNFKCDGATISGTLNRLRNSISDKKFTERSDLTLTLENGKEIHRITNRTTTWLAGSDTHFDPTDDIIEITGTVSVNDSEGNIYNRTITEPLVRKGSCKYVVKGIVTLTANEGVFATINYGNGDCDNSATLTTSKGGTTTITIGKK